MAIIKMNKEYGKADNGEAVLQQKLEEARQQSVIALLDEKGTRVDFQVVDSFAHEELQYVVMVPVKKEDPDVEDVVVMYEDPEDEDSLLEVDDEKTRLEILKIFATRVQFGESLMKRIQDEANQK